MAQHGKLLVSGATGTAGGQVVKQLAEAGADLRALARDPGAAVLLDGVNVVRGDLSDPASLEQPLRDVGAVFLVWPFMASAGASQRWWCMRSPTTTYSGPDRCSLDRRP